MARISAGVGFWLIERDVFASDQHVCAVSAMGARREDVDAQTRVISIFRYRDGRQVNAGSTPTTQPPGTRSSPHDS
jgi:hypothetical protein